MTDLFPAWQALCARLAIASPAADTLGHRLLRAWSRWPRRYHGPRHLAACVQSAEQWRSACAAPDAVAWALWFHDAVYWPWRRDNERRSADWARDSAIALGQPPAVYARYAQDVRREYFWVLPGAWRLGRAAVLRHFLSQPSIYGNAAFRDRHEATARTNLQCELQALAA